jgi:hypothetical protein
MTSESGNINRFLQKILTMISQSLGNSCSFLKVKKIQINMPLLQISKMLQIQYFQHSPHGVFCEITFFSSSIIQNLQVEYVKQKSKHSINS